MQLKSLPPLFTAVFPHVLNKNTALGMEKKSAEKQSEATYNNHICSNTPRWVSIRGSIMKHSSMNCVVSGIISNFKEALHQLRL